MAQLISVVYVFQIQIQKKREIQFIKYTLFMNVSASAIILCLFFSTTGSCLMSSKSSQIITNAG